ncbi:hypothetical protein ALQ42_02789 [Pseudomonas savastanoi pv. glycinea]|uniref:Uncharacterized protein n=1 Tax=Pseudomonas savastanoi pv. glycinea TaxID=318 RepID=A0A3M3U4X1_PSESG|nr:hypothetical protein ALQ42_02789 [Pseudomonas savastanoi pv. glycinea]
MLTKINQYPCALDFIHMTRNAVRHDAAQAIFVKEVFQTELDVVRR